MLATTLHGLICTTPSIHRLRLGLLGYLIPFALLYIFSSSHCRPSRVLSPLVFFSISTHFTAPQKFPLAPPYSNLVASTACPGLSKGFDGGLKKPPIDALRPIIPDNTCILYLTATAPTELADVYSPDTVIASSPGKDVHDAWAFYLHMALLHQPFAHCGIFPNTTSLEVRTLLGSVTNQAKKCTISRTLTLSYRIVGGVNIE